MPCGQCLSCRINRTRIWAARMQMELKTVQGVACHVTLTYRDEDCPVSLDPDALTLALKRIRHHVKRKITYYACGEYGRTTWRPHYHLGLFGVQLPLGVHTEGILSQIWPFGAVHVTEFTEATAPYVAKHLSKGVRPEQVYEWMRPEFSRMSRRPALGLRYIQDHLGPWLTTKSGASQLAVMLDVPDTVDVGGKQPVPIGRYLRRKLRTEVGWNETMPLLTQAVQFLEKGGEAEKIEETRVKRKLSEHKANLWLAKSYKGEKI